MADQLLRSISDFDHTTQDRNSPDPDSLDTHPQKTVARRKRAQVQVACEACKRRKAKCDARRPCSACEQRNIPCQYLTRDGETYPQALKRKYEDVTQSHETYAELFHMLQAGNEQDAVRIFRRIRTGYSAKQILDSMNTDNDDSYLPDPRRLALRQYLISLAHSTGSHRDVVRLATLALDSHATAQLPSPDDFHKFRNRVARLPHLEAMLKRPKRPKRPKITSISHLIDTTPDAAGGDSALHSGARSDRVDSDADIRANGDAPDQPPHQVPASPWTNISASDEAVSHLISLFLAWINPTWRFVEQDLFLRAMRSKRLGSTFCSPFLVNSICAIASLHSEHEAAFAPHDNSRVMRGMHFHDEALRLWALEESRPSITNVQALCVLALESNYRAKDRLGLTLLPIAVQLDKDIPAHRNDSYCAAQGITTRDYSRGRLATHWTAKCIHIITRIAFLGGAPAESRVPGLPEMHQVFNDEVEMWNGYPLEQSAVPYRPTLYFRERCRLAGFLQELHDLISATRVTIREFVVAVDALLDNLHYWYQHLPFELHYDWPMSVDVWELHVSHHATLMILLTAARTRLLQEQADSDEEGPTNDAEARAADTDFKSRMAEEKLVAALPLAHQAAQMLREFRERYGLKISPAWGLQLQAVTAGVLLQDPGLVSCVQSTSSTTQDTHTPIRDSHSAFDEVFRCLLGAGVEVMIARGIARMMYHTALERNIALTPSTKRMIKIMSDTAWRPSDLSLVNSAFPNFATTKGYEDPERMTELLFKWEALEI